jgi:hypothetical protein
VVADAEASVTKIEAKQILQIMAAPDFGDACLVAANWGNFVAPQSDAKAFHHTWRQNVAALDQRRGQ